MREVLFAVAGELCLEEEKEGSRNDSAYDHFFSFRKKFKQRGHYINSLFFSFLFGEVSIMSF